MLVFGLLISLVPLASALSQKPLLSSPISSIPLLGFGTWNVSPNASDVVSYALQAGYRHIDGAAIYRNEPEVGRGIKAGLKKTGLAREEIWITSKLWNEFHDPKQVEPALDRTLKDLGVAYLDLYLMHWPASPDSNGKYKENFLDTWKAMMKLPATGKVKHIGVCNFSPAQLKSLIDAAGPDGKPYAHQMELHPYLPQSAWLQYHAEQGIHVTAYSPLANMNPTYKPGDDGPVPLLKNDVVIGIAEKRGCSPAQVALAWGLSRGTSVIPKSKQPSRIEENFAKCELEYEDLAKLERLGDKPVRFSNPSKSWGIPVFEGLTGT